LRLAKPKSTAYPKLWRQSQRNPWVFRKRRR